MRSRSIPAASSTAGRTSASCSTCATSWIPYAAAASRQVDPAPSIKTIDRRSPTSSIAFSRSRSHRGSYAALKLLPALHRALQALEPGLVNPVVELGQRCIILPLGRRIDPVCQAFEMCRPLDDARAVAAVLDHHRRKVLAGTYRTVNIGVGEAHGGAVVVHQPLGDPGTVASRDHPDCTDLIVVTENDPAPLGHRQPPRLTVEVSHDRPDRRRRRIDANRLPRRQLIRLSRKDAPRETGDRRKHHMPKLHRSPSGLHYGLEFPLESSADYRRHLRWSSPFFCDLCVSKCSRLKARLNSTAPPARCTACPIRMNPSRSSARRPARSFRAAAHSSTDRTARCPR